MFQGSSGNNLSNATTHVANGNITIHNYSGPPPHGIPHGYLTENTQALQLRLFTFSYVVSIFSALFRAVTLAAQESETLSETQPIRQSNAAGSPPRIEQANEVVDAVLPISRGVGSNPIIADQTVEQVATELGTFEMVSMPFILLGLLSFIGNGGNIG